MTPKQELEQVTRNSLLKATGPDGDLIRGFAAQMRHDRAAYDALAGAVVDEVETWEPLSDAQIAEHEAHNQAWREQADDMRTAGQWM